MGERIGGRVRQLFAIQRAEQFQRIEERPAKIYAIRVGLNFALADPHQIHAFHASARGQDFNFVRAPSKVSNGGNFRFIRRMTDRDTGPFRSLKGVELAC